MQTLLNDIELDIQELKFLIQAISGDANPALRVVAKRNILQMQERLNLLSKQLDAACAVTAKDEDVSSAGITPVHVPVIPDPVSSVVSSSPVITSAEPASPVASPTTPILAERIKSATDLRHAISLNDSFRFTRELFGGNSARMNQVVCEIGEAPTLEKALSIYLSTVHPDEDNEASAHFIELLKKYFN